MKFGRWGTTGTQDQKAEDSQHMLDQPRRSFHESAKGWEKESIHRPAPAQNFSLQKKGCPLRKISVVDTVVLVLIGFLYPPPAWKVFL